MPANKKLSALTVTTNPPTNALLYVVYGGNQYAATLDTIGDIIGGGGGTWGSITGTLSAQTDLQAALDAKAVTSGTLAQFAATTSAQLRGVISDETGTGALVFATSPTLVTPTLGVATATSLNGLAVSGGAFASIAIGGGTTLSVVAGKDIFLNNSLTLAGTDGVTLDLNSDLVTSGSSITVGSATITLGASKTLTASNTLTFTGTDGVSLNATTSGTLITTGNLSDITALGAVTSGTIDGVAIGGTTQAAAKVTQLDVRASGVNVATLETSSGCGLLRLRAVSAGTLSGSFYYDGPDQSNAAYAAFGVATSGGSFGTAGKVLLSSSANGTGTQLPVSIGGYSGGWVDWLTLSITGNATIPNGSLSVGGPVKLGSYTVATMPSAATYSGFYIDVSDAAAGPGLARSNGSNWKIPNTNTTIT